METLDSPLVIVCGVVEHGITFADPGVPLMRANPDAGVSHQGSPSRSTNEAPHRCRSSTRCRLAYSLDGVGQSAFPVLELRHGWDPGRLVREARVNERRAVAKGMRAAQLASRKPFNPQWPCGVSRQERAKSSRSAYDRGPQPSRPPPSQCRRRAHYGDQVQRNAPRTLSAGTATLHRRRSPLIHATLSSTSKKRY